MKKLTIIKIEKYIQNKAFTLVELLGVIIILGVIALITFPIINKSIKNSKEQALERVIDNIEKAAYEYSITNDIGYQEYYKSLSLNDLVSSGILNNKIINPVTNEEMQGCVLYKWQEDYKQYEFKYEEDCSILTYASHYVNYGGLYNDTFNSGIATSDGGYVAVGTTNSENIEGLEKKDATINNDALIVKFDNKGNIVWQDTFGGIGTDNYFDVIEIIEDNQRYYIAVGYSSSIDGDLYLNGVTSSYDKPIIVKYDENGNIIDKKIFLDRGYNISIKKISDGYIVGGLINYDGSIKGEIYNNKKNDYKGTNDATIIKLNDNFDVEWSSYFGGTNAEWFNDFVITDFGYVAVGLGRSIDGDMTDIFSDSDAWVYDGIIVSYDKNGNVLEKNAFGSSEDDAFNEIVEVDDGYIVVGYARKNDLDLVNSEKIGAVIVKYNKNLQLEKYIVIDNNSLNSFNSILLDNNRIIVVGSMVDDNLYTDGIILEITKDLEIVKEERFKGNNSDHFNKIIKSNNNYIVFGSSFSKGKSTDDVLDQYAKGNQDAIIVNYDSNLNLIKSFEKTVNIELVAKEVVEDYGESIPSYENKNNLKIYTTNNPSEDIGNWCDQNSIYSGNNDNYNYTYCLKPFNNSDIIQMYEKTNSEGTKFIKGLNDYKINLNTDKVDMSNSWFRLFIYNTKPISDFKLIFNGKKYSIQESVDLGYIEPLVLYGYGDSIIDCVIDDRNSILSNGTLSVSGVGAGRGGGEPGDCLCAGHAGQDARRGGGRRRAPVCGRRGGREGTPLAHADGYGQAGGRREH